MRKARRRRERVKGPAEGTVEAAERIYREVVENGRRARPRWREL
ncbi:MAG: hypothetical protein ACP5RJ_08640 [Conexivisphaera sp.]